LAHLRRSDRSIRTLQREADREAELLKEIGHWQDIQETCSPESTDYEQALQHITRLLDSPPQQDTTRVKVAGGWNDLVWTVKEAGLISLQMLVIIVFNVAWWAFLILVALPIVWDWFWQLPSGLLCGARHGVQ